VKWGTIIASKLTSRINLSKEIKMATITNAVLGIIIDAAHHTAKCTVTATVNFTKYEMNEIKEGLTFRLDCSLKANEPANPIVPYYLVPKLLYTFPSKYFPDPTPTSPEAVKFEATVPQAQLNSGAGSDDVYGLLVLTNQYTEITRQKKTNVITYSF
jgi:hypothetical protein